MGCNEWSCGTGSGKVILPNDPSNNSVLSAIGVSGGVQLSWTYPTSNPYGVAYVNVFRGINEVFANAVLLAQTASSFYFDAIDDSEIRTYFYWIQIVSINGTEMETIGPVSAIPGSSIEKTIQGLTGRIDAGVLATSLRTEIDRITSLDALLKGEVENRTFRDSVVAEALGAVQASAGAALNQIVAETATRETADEALIDRVNLLMSSVDNTTAALLTEQITRAATDAALSQQITQAEVALGDQFASVQTNMAADIAVIDGKVHSLGALWTAKVTVNNLIGGFGVYNNGQIVEAGFDVDTFWVGRTGPDKIKPFIIDKGVVYINEGAINKLTFSKLRDESGSFVVQNGKVQAQYIQADQLVVNGAQITDGTITTAKIGEAEIDTLRIQGNAITVPLSVSHNTSGDVTSASADFGGGVVQLIMNASLNAAVTDRSIMTLYLYRDGALLTTQDFQLFEVGRMDTESATYVDYMGGGMLMHLDSPGSGSHYYRARAYINTGGASIKITLLALGVKR